MKTTTRKNLDIWDAPRLLGSSLIAEDRRYALAAYVHRYTKDHKPGWANERMSDGTAYPVQFASDSEWLAHTEFAVTKTGRLDHRCTSCISHPTWPDNPELRK